jgi:hypothetical protein
MSSIEAMQIASASLNKTPLNRQESTMNSKSIYAACLFAALNICTLSARAESQVQPETYTYGSHLDVRKVLSVSEGDGAACSVVNARMTYLDSQNQEHILDYRKFSDHCNEGS